MAEKDEDITTIRLHKETKKMLREFEKMPEELYENIIIRLMKMSRKYLEQRKSNNG